MRVRRPCTPIQGKSRQYLISMMKMVTMIIIVINVKRSWNQSRGPGGVKSMIKMVRRRVILRMIKIMSLKMLMMDYVDDEEEEEGKEEYDDDVVHILVPIP